MSQIRFESAFQDLTKNSPFPWQEQLFARFMSGGIERSLDIPTGLGKTAVMAIWLIARASGARSPRRLAYVVDRRAVVDQATEVAIELRDWVDSRPEFKRLLGLDNRSLPISTLRGQHVDNREWLEDPASPAIIVCTVDMIGSRLLFEGYGVSRKMRPFQAGLLGADALVVLDEAHLVPPFEKLVEAIAVDCPAFGPREEAARSIVPAFKLMSLSATGRPHSGTPFTLTDRDLEHKEVRKRLDAKKRLSLRPLAEGRTLPEALADEAWELAQKGTVAARVIVFCDRRKDAEEAEKTIRRKAKGNNDDGVEAFEIDSELFVGGRRVKEREDASQRLRELGFLAGTDVPRSRPAFVFATSAGEVGVDLDADHMVSDLVAWERMVQRLGRVNRRGDGVARVIVIVEPDTKPTKQVKDALAKNASQWSEKEQKGIAAHEAKGDRHRARLKPFEYLSEIDNARDASPGAIRQLKSKAEHDEQLRGVLDAAATPVPLRPALTRAVVDAWSMTSLKEHTGRPEIGPWLRGWIDDPPQTSIVWRTHLPTRTGGQVASKEIEAFFEAAPPHLSEVLETETSRVLAWLTPRAKALAKGSNDAEDVEAPTIRRTDVIAMILSSSGDWWASLTLKDCLFEGDDEKANKKRKETLEKRLAGATLIVDARCAGLKIGLLDSGEKEIPPTIDDGKTWLPAGDHGPAVRFRVRAVDADTADGQEDRRQWRQRLRFPTTVSDVGEPERWLVVEKWRDDGATEDDRSVVGRAQSLKDHQTLAELRAHELAKRLGLPTPYDEMLAIVARLHDEGKRARRWQRAFNAPPAGGPYAKTVGPLNLALLDGYRHEFTSLAVAASDREYQKLPPDLQELALHLIAAHHGFARPIIGTSGCEDAPPSRLEERAREVALRFARLQRRWGPWGLAWWESLLRAADHQASRENEEADSDQQEGKG